MEQTKKTKIHKLLALKPAEHEIGYAIMAEDGYLIFGSHQLRGSGPERREEAFAFLGPVIRGFDVDAIALEKTPDGVAGLSAVPTTDDIAAWEHRAGLEVHMLDLDEIRLCVAGSATASDADLARVVAARIPYLERYRAMDERSPQPEWNVVFRAVALALAERDLRLKTTAPGIRYSF